MFAIGGYTGQGRATTKTVEMLLCDYDTTAEPLGGWTSVAPLLEARNSHAAAFYKGGILVAGGSNTKSVERFTLPCDAYPRGQWTLIQPRMSRTLMCSSLVVIGDSLVAVGKQT